MTEFNLDTFFELTDSMNSESFVSFFNQEAKWFFGNSDPLEGKDQIKQMAEQFFHSLKKIKHEIDKTARSGNTIFFDGVVHYYRHDNNLISLPFACSIELKNEKIEVYKTYIDLTPYLAFETRI